MLEGILTAARYASMIEGLLGAHQGRSFVFYLDVSLEETLRRHATRPQAAEFTSEDMRGWYLPRDLLGVDGEQVVPEHSTLDQTVAFIGAAAGLVPASPIRAAPGSPAP
ncbi:hypothetical protein ALLO2DRAFT_02595 [Frankia sp. Allo2]|nr:hypothetical protein [Frankia sp. Allo2]KFB04665.1 hypothetical protein ALLO2DRAFT_02595 [Frankia sp. Allo2]OAA22595.1 hypothetical protein AAY23_106235 [Frankia casuarinae]